MSRRDLKVRPGILNKDSSCIINITVVDRAIIDDDDLNHLLGHLPTPSAARIDSDNYKSFMGIDMFYDQESLLRGVVFVFGTQALVVRVPTNVAQKTAAAYEAEKKAAAKITFQANKSKGKRHDQPTSSQNPSFDRLRRLLQSDLVGFGMTQISLTLWHFLHERVNGVNLSTILSEPISSKSSIPKSNNEPTTAAESENKQNKKVNNSGGKRGKGGSRNQKGRRGGATASNKDSQKHQLDEPEGNDDNAETAQSASLVVLLDDEPQNLDRKPLSPGEVVKQIFPDQLRFAINAFFMGEDEAITLEERVGEAVMRAWISYVVADKLNKDVQNAPVIRPLHLTDKELNFFAESMVNKWKILGETSPVRKLQLSDYNFEGNQVKSNNYTNKIRSGKHQYMAILEEGVEKRHFLHRQGKSRKHAQLAEDESDDDEDSAPPSTQRPDDGRLAPSRGSRRGNQQRSGQVREYGEETSEFQAFDSATLGTGAEAPSIDIPENAEVILYGREEATSAEKQGDMFLLRLLEGRGFLHGPDYKDCAFIRRVWFPTLAQLHIGEDRKERKNKNKKKRDKQSFIDDSWDDDTDEEEVARIQALTLAEGNEDRDDETEDENIGSQEPKRGVLLPPEIRLNPSQLGVVGRIVSPNPDRRTRATLVHGPPGTGKTSTIAAAVWILAKVDEPPWIVAQSNVGIKNVAEKLQEVGFLDFVLLVAQDYEVYWEERYKSLKKHYFSTNKLINSVFQKRLFDSRAVLCTLATLSSPVLTKNAIFTKRPLQHLIIDEASQIDMTSEFMHLFYKHRSTLMSVCWFGDPNQLPPYGSSDGSEIKDIFKVDHLLANSKLLDTSYRLPVPIAKFISSKMYEGDLKPFVKHKVQQPQKAVVFIDVAAGQEEKAGNQGTSWKNTAEADVVVKLVQQYYERSVKQDYEEEEERLEYAIITPYEGQRSYVQDEMKKAGMERQVYNVDSFQGNEADYIITTIAKTGTPGFLTSRNRMNVLLTRCKRGLVVVSQKDFVQRTDSLLRGLIYSIEPYDPWVSAEDVIAGYVNLPGSPALNVRPPPPKAAPPVPVSRTSLPPRPGASAPPLASRSPLAAQVVRQGLVPSSTSSPAAAPVRGAWGNATGVNRIKSPWSR